MTHTVTTLRFDFPPAELLASTPAEVAATVRQLTGAHEEPLFGMETELTEPDLTDPELQAGEYPGAGHAREMKISRVMTSILGTRHTPRWTERRCGAATQLSLRLRAELGAPQQLDARIHLERQLRLVSMDDMHQAAYETLLSMSRDADFQASLNQRYQELGKAAAEGPGQN